MSCFKILFDLNNEKYSVLVKTEEEFIEFKTVLNEFIRQTNQQNISFESHLFEVLIYFIFYLKF